MERLLEEYFQMKLKWLSKLYGRKKPHILLNIFFPIDTFYGFSLPGNFLS